MTKAASGIQTSSASSSISSASPLASSGGRRRRNSLIDIAATLPNLDASLDAFIAKVNATDADTSNWSLPAVSDAISASAAEMEAAHAVELERLRHRMTLEVAATEKKLEASGKKIEALSAELAATQAELATRPASNPNAAPNALADVEFELNAIRQESRSWQERARNAEKQIGEQQAAIRQLETAAASAKSAAATVSLPANYADIQLANDRARAAIAAARAAAAGIAVSPTDLDKIESGVPKAYPSAVKKTPWLALGGAFVGGALLAFGGAQVLGGESQAKPAAVAAPTVTPIAAPEVTPIANAAAPQPAANAALPQPAANEAAAPASVEAAAEINVDIEATAPSKPAPAVATPATVKSPGVSAKPAALSKPAAAKPAAAKPAAAKPAAVKPASPTKKAGGIVDPF